MDRIAVCDWDNGKAAACSRSVRILRRKPIPFCGMIRSRANPDLNVQAEQSRCADLNIRISALNNH
ncbi:MAG: hypothetical protein ABSG10_11675 [Terracidiphilus sp.]|jgi:hypothetical protein